MNNKKRAALALWALCLCLASSLPGQQTQENSVATEPQNIDEIIYSWSRTFAEVLQALNQKHYKVNNLEQAMTKAIDTLLNAVDPHSNLLDPKTYKSMIEMTSGEFFGIGIIIDNTRNSKDKALTVVDTIADGPADKAGIKAYDKIVEVDGAVLEGMSTDEATSKLKGERNSKVTVKVLRENQNDLLTFEITRDVIKEQNSLCFYLEEQNVYYLSLTMFNENSAKQLEDLLTKAQEKEYRGLILDLRNNSGGLLTSVIDIAGLFIEKGSLVVTTKDKKGAVIDKYLTTRNPIAANIPIFILINNYTASAAEILAGCLKIHADKESNKKNSKNKMVFLVGTKTFGKGSVQEVMPISNNCAIKITTSLYFLPDDTSIQAEGIVPDFETERCQPPSEQLQWFTKNYGREQALTNHITLKKDSKAASKTPEKKEESIKKTWAERARTMLATDNQLKETLHLINLLHVGKTTCNQTLASRKQALDFLQSVFVGSNKIKLVEIK